MDIEKGNNRTATDYHIISICYTSSTIAPTTDQWWAVVRIEDYGWKESNGPRRDQHAGVCRVRVNAVVLLSL